ncbi:MAG: transporter [Herbinix sp.]|jgi:MFS family permease|nr:transporter [Herbinix sp.]
MNQKNFKIVVIGQIISLLGNTVQRFCMSLYVLETTGSAAIFSAILAISTIPYILMAPIAGYLADTINRKKLMIALDVISAGLMAAYAITMNHSDHYVITAIAMVFLSVIYTLYNPAVVACVPQIVEKDKLTSANSIIQQVGYLVNMVGPILAGFLYGVVGIRTVIWINAISFLASAVLELFLEIPDMKNREVFKNPLISSIKEMGRSFVYIKSKKRIVLGIMISYALTNIFVVPVLSVVTPYFINIVLKMPSQIYGYVEAIFVLGMVMGSLFLTLRPNFFTMKKLYKTMLPMLLAIILMVIATGLDMAYAFAAIGIYAVGGFGIMLSLALSNIISLSYMQKEVEENMLGKVSALSTAIATASVAPGQILFGQLIERDLSLVYILLLTFVFSLGVVCFIGWNTRELRKDTVSHLI